MESNMLHLPIWRFKFWAAIKENAGATQSKLLCVESCSLSALFFSRQQDRKTRAQKTYFFNMLRLAAFLQLFHFWQADKAGFMWHNNKKCVSTFPASAPKSGLQLQALTCYSRLEDMQVKQKKQMSECLLKDTFPKMQLCSGHYSCWYCSG